MYHFFYVLYSKEFTEVGYVGRDVESMVRDLVDMAIDMVREEEILSVEDEAERQVTEQILDALLPTTHPDAETLDVSDGDQEENSRSTRDKLRDKMEAGELEER